MTTTTDQQPQESKPIVLLVDDSPDVHRLLKARLRYEELELVSAEGGEQGLVLAAERKPTLLLLDLDMPGVDGFTVLRKVKADPNTVGTAVIVLSGLHSPQDKVTAFDLGAVDYITKPFELTELRVRVRSALKMQRLLQMLAQKAQIDGLTGLWNRAFFNNRWAEEEARVQRHRHPLSIVMIDVDHFKSINDTYGHPAGDAVLQELAKLLQRECRTADIPCRYGGEEFAVIMPDTEPQDAMVLCERIRAGLAGLEWSRHPERKITASMGLAGVMRGVPMAADTKLVDLADQALYAAKRGGRNRVGLADVPVVKLRAAS